MNAKVVRDQKLSWKWNPYFPKAVS